MGTSRTSATRDQIVQYFTGKAWRHGESEGEEFTAENPNSVVRLWPANQTYHVKVWAKEDPNGPDADSTKTDDPTKFLKQYIEGPIHLAAAPLKTLVRAILRRASRGSERVASVGGESPDWAKELESKLRREGWSCEMDGDTVKAELEEFEASIEPLSGVWNYEFRLNWTDEKEAKGRSTDPLSEYIKFQRDTQGLVKQHAEDEFGWGDLD